MNRLEQLAFSIADSAARSDIESNFARVGFLPIDGELITGSIYDTRYIDIEEDRVFIDEAVEYLELRGMIGRSEGAPHLVFFKPTHAQEGTTP